MRMMFKASDGCVIVGGDFSQQEPRLLTHMCGDEKLRETYNNKRDLYATIGSSIFHKDYWECMEKWEDGSPNTEGKALRSKCKQIVLGISYGMGAKLMASNMGVSVDECKTILDSFFKMFPKVKEFTAQNEKTAKEIGYVEDYMGRRRHLPDAQKSEIEVRAKKDVVTNADICMNVELEDCRVEIPDEEKIKEWTKKWQEAEASGRFDAKKKFKEEAKHSNINLMDNGAFISKTMTQCTNARIQGSAASLTKKAMIKIFNDKQLNDWGFKILIPVHDELLGECNIENAEQVEKRLSELMIEAGKPECSVDMKVDTYVVKHWYQDEVNNIIFEKYQQYINGNPKKNIASISEEEAIKKICESYPELLEKTVRAICNQTFDVLSEEI